MLTDGGSHSGVVGAMAMGDGWNFKNYKYDSRCRSNLLYCTCILVVIFPIFLSIIGLRIYLVVEIVQLLSHHPRKQHRSLMISLTGVRQGQGPAEQLGCLDTTVLHPPWQIGSDSSTCTISMVSCEQGIGDRFCTFIIMSR